MTFTPREVATVCGCCAFLAFLCGYALGQMREMTKQVEVNDALLRGKLEDL